MSKEDALKLAEEKNLDLILITIDSNPSIAKIANFDKFRYQKEKEDKEKNKSSKKQELKHIQFSARSAKHDIETQIKKVNSFLEKGNNVELILRLRGREKGNKEWAKSKMEEFLSEIGVEYKVVSPMKFGGRGINMQIRP